MTKRLTPYGLSDYADTIAKVGKLKATTRLAVRMPAPEIAAKVGTVDIQACHAARTHRVVRRNARA